MSTLNSSEYLEQINLESALKLGEQTWSMGLIVEGGWVGMVRWEPLRLLPNPASNQATH